MRAARRGLLPLGLDDVVVERDGQRLLGGITVELGNAPVTVVLGPNGAGKTLLLRVARGLLTPTRGVVSWGGRGPAEAAAAIGYVPQHPVMLRRSARANVGYALALARAPRSRRRARADSALAAVRLGHLARVSAPRLSGGERQRLAIARAWAQRPTALLLDEPAAHLDPASATLVERTIAGVRDAGTRVIVSTHDLHQARRLADEVVFIHAGRVVEHARAADFFDRPASAEAGRFIAGELLA